MSLVHFVAQLRIEHQGVAAAKKVDGTHLTTIDVQRSARWEQYKSTVWYEVAGMRTRRQMLVNASLQQKWEISREASTETDLLLSVCLVETFEITPLQVYPRRTKTAPLRRCNVCVALHLL